MTETNKQQHTHTYTLTQKIQQDLEAHEKKIEAMEASHTDRMRRARLELRRLKELLGMAEGYEL